ncbi:MAG: GNAT family N-acetyltransferase [Chloroflexi bacterium]|nr:GNAT family N-acetyltransferase [Chloroflexota bacterium]
MVIDKSVLEKYKKAVILKDGSTLHLRPIVQQDEERILALFSRLSRHSLYLRFHHVLTQMSKEEAKRFCNVDYEKNFALAATLGEDSEEKIIAVGNFYRMPAMDRAESAFVVEDAYQGKGIGTHLLQQLATIAREMGINVFESSVLAENAEMLQLLQRSGFYISEEMESGVYQMEMELVPTPTVERMSAEREKVASVASLQAFLKPRSIAVIGATQRVGSIGNKVFYNILHQGLTGVVYPVNPNAKVVCSVSAYPSVLDIPGDVDLAIVIVPAKGVNKVVQECGRKGVRGVVIISAGFGEAGPEGIERQQQLLDTARNYGMRMVGPNCMGVLNTDPEVNMNATFSPVFPPVGSIAMATQSGALGLAILEYAENLNIGLSTFVSVGNKADVSSNDLIQYWEEDPSTKVILLYLESFGNPAKFGRIARRISAEKPIVVVKSGRTLAGSRAAASHTGALATTEIASDALFKQAGIIRVDSLEELFDVANLLVNQPLPNGKRIAILTNGGGPGILTADACAARGLELPSLAKSTVSKLKRFLPKEASLVNPVDMTAGPSAEDYKKAMKIMAQDENIDILIVIFIPPVVTEPEAIAKAIREVAPRFREQGKTLVASFMSSRGAPSELGSKEEGHVPTFTFPEATAGALAKICDYSEWLKRPAGKIPRFTNIDRRKAARIIEEALGKSSTRPLWLSAKSTVEVLEAYGIQVVPTRLAKTAKEAADVAEEIGFPVCAKLLSKTITHKTDIGGVALDLRSRGEVEQAFARIRHRLENEGLGNEMGGVIVQNMIKGGLEVIVGVTQDPSFGPLILFGYGGIYTELYKDVAFRIHPLTDLDTSEMVRSTKAYKLLEGWRGAKRADVESLEELLLRISAMVEDIPQLVELDLNPVKVKAEGKGYSVVDARIMISDVSLKSREWDM